MMAPIPSNLPHRIRYNFSKIFEDEGHKRELDGKEWGTGMMNAKVFPEPVLAAPKTSLPQRVWGRAAL